MITKKTVFITAAGASAIYGFPIGKSYKAELIRAGKIINSYVSDLNLSHIVNWNIPEVTQIIEDMENTDFNSIDDWMHLNNKDNNATWLKIMIVYVMLSSENRDLLIKNKTPDEDHYLKNIWLKMSDEVMSKNDFMSNDITFVTFNYDRSIEFYFWNNIIRNFKIFTEGERIEMFKSIKFIHVYGGIKFFIDIPENLELFNYAEYGAKETFSKSYFEKLLTLSQFISFIHDGPDEIVMSDVFQNASKIFILGFGYNKKNFDLLNLNYSIHSGNIISTKKGLTAKVIEERKLAIRNFHGNYKINFFDGTIVELLNKYL